MSGTVKLNSAGGGSISLTPASTASNVTATVPAATDTLVNLASSQSLSNKTITAANTNTVEATSGPTSTQLAGQRNKIINGAMMIDQRNAGASVTPASSAYTIDRWKFITSPGSKFSFQQSSTVPSGFTTSLISTSLSAYSSGSGDVFRLCQFIEGFNVADLGFGAAGASTVTISFWVRSSLTGTFPVGLINENADRSYVATYTINSANTFEYKTITIAGDTSGTWPKTNGIGLGVIFDLGSGTSSNTTAGSWQAGNYSRTSACTSVVGTNGATFYITGVQLEKGATATPFENRLYGTELALCERYFQVDSNNGGAYVHLYPGYYATTTGAAFVKTFTVDMRSTPTATATAANTFLVDGASPLTPSAISFPGYGTNKTYRISATVVGGVAGQAVILAGAGSGTATITYSAEL